MRPNSKSDLDLLGPRGGVESEGEVLGCSPGGNPSSPGKTTWADVVPAAEAAGENKASFVLQHLESALPG